MIPNNNNTNLYLYSFTPTLRDKDSSKRSPEIIQALGNVRTLRFGRSKVGHPTAYPMSKQRTNAGCPSSTSHSTSLKPLCFQMSPPLC